MVRLRAGHTSMAASLEYFHNCTALITGASSGIGREIAVQLASHAGRLILVGRRKERLEELANRLRHSCHGLSVYPKPVDLRDGTEIDALVDWLQQEGVEVNFLVNNAGLGDYGLFETSEWERVEEMLRVNIDALTRLTHGLLPGMLKKREGAILNVGSVAGMLPLPLTAVYAATKAYVNSLSEALRVELRGTGITVTVLCPGPVSTEFGEVARRDDEGQPVQSPEVLRMPLRDVAREGLEAVVRDRPRAVPGLLLAMLVGLLACLPMFIIRVLISYGRRPSRDEEEEE